MSPTREAIPALIEAALGNDPVDPGALEDVLHGLMEGASDPVSIGGLLIALRARRQEAPLLAAAARVLRSHGTTVRPTVRPLVDTCGTGGDGAGTFNVSTTTAMLAAAGGCAVAKHGNRSVSSQVGSADVLEAAGCTLELSAQQAGRLLDATGFAFLYAPTFHPALRHVAPIRRSLGVRTLFNLLGPLANPTAPEWQVVGVYDAALTGVVAEALAALGTRGALVVHCAGLDEIGLHGVTTGHRLRDGAVEPFRLDPADLGLARVPVEALAGGDAAENVRITRSVLGGEPGPCAEVVALNTAASLLVAERVDDLAAGLEEARGLLASGAGLRVLERYAESTGRLAGEGA